MSAAPAPTENVAEFAIQQSILAALDDTPTGAGEGLVLIDGERLLHVTHLDDGTIFETRPVYLVIGDPE